MIKDKRNTLSVENNDQGIDMIAEEGRGGFVLVG